MTPADIRSDRFRSSLENTFRADATLDPDLFAAGLTEGATFRLGANPAVVGREAVRKMLRATFQAFTSVGHVLRQAYELADVFIYEGTVTYSLKDGSAVTADYANVLRFDGPLVADYRIYIDLSPLAAR